MKKIIYILIFTSLIASISEAQQLKWGFIISSYAALRNGSYSLEGLSFPIKGTSSNAAYTITCATLPKKGIYGISGKIWDLLTKDEVGSATVELRGLRSSIRSQITDASGSYKITGLNPGTYTLIVTRDGYFTATRTIEVKSQESRVRSQDVAICPTTRHISANTWMMFSPPAKPETVTYVSGNTITVGANLGTIDNMGRLEFRTYRWDPTKPDDDPWFAKYVRPNTIKSGESYWFKVYGSDANLHLSENSMNSMNSTNSITLSPGWNMLANPFSFIVKKDDLRIGTESLGTYTDDLWLWTGTKYESSDALLPWKGYFVWADKQSTFTVFPIHYDNKDEGLKLFSLPKGFIKLSVRSGQYSDEGFIGFGMRIASKKPPIPFGEYVRLSIGNLARDVREEIKDINIWDIQVSGNTGKPTTLSLTGDFPKGYDVWLIDGNNAYDMRKHSSLLTPHSSLKIKIMKPNSGLVIETLEITNIITYPNPAKDSAIVRISAKTSNAGLKMEVYNILGQKVIEQGLSQSQGKKWASFSESEQAYIYEAGYSCQNSFNQRLSNGLYFLKVIAREDGKETSKIGKMLIKRR